jgi:hypothetical protein
LQSVYGFRIRTDSVEGRIRADSDGLLDPKYGIRQPSLVLHQYTAARCPRTATGSTRADYLLMVNQQWRCGGGPAARWAVVAYELNDGGRARGVHVNVCVQNIELTDQPTIDRPTIRTRVPLYIATPL